MSIETSVHPVRLEDYTPPPYLIETVDVDIHAKGTFVSLILKCQRNLLVPGPQALVLDILQIPRR